MACVTANRGLTLGAANLSYEEAGTPISSPGDNHNRRQITIKTLLAIGDIIGVTQIW